MIDYTAAGPVPADAPLWSRTFLQPLAPGALTPFSASVLAEMINRSWYTYFDRLGFEPAPRPRAVRLVEGRPYVNLSLGAALDAQYAGSEPPAVCINGQVRALAKWEKPGFLAGLKTGRGAKKIADTLQALPGEIDAATRQGKAWLERVQVMHWSQAEILQVMEEIERIGSSIMLPFFAARYNLEIAYRRLLGLAECASAPQQLALIAQALGPVGDSVEAQIARLAAEGAAGADNLLAAYGHRAFGEGELYNPRWFEDADALKRRLGSSRPAPTAPAADERALLAAVDGKRRKDAQALVQQIRELLPLQSKALNAAAYVLAGTRVWALAAGHEAMADHRVLERDDIFFYELEETKQMMTGEWNISDLGQIHATAVERKEQRDAQAAKMPAELLLGDTALVLAGTGGQPGAPGQARGVLALDAANATRLSSSAIFGCTQADAGYAVLVPQAAALVMAQGSLIDPIVGAAAAWKLPVVCGLGDGLAALAAGSPAAVDVAVDGAAGTVSRG